MNKQLEQGLKEDTLVANKHTERHTTPRMVKKMHINTTVLCPYMPLRMAKVARRS